MKHEIEPWPRTCAMLRVHYHINAVKRCCERTRTARRRALCGRRRLRHAAAMMLRQAGCIAPARIVGDIRTSPTFGDRFDERPRISHPFRLFSRNCRAFRFDCFLISNSTFLSTIARLIDVQSTCFSHLSDHLLLTSVINHTSSIFFSLFLPAFHLSFLPFFSIFFSFSFMSFVRCNTQSHINRC